MSALLSRIGSRAATFGVIGQGYVGPPLGLLFWEAGFCVVRFDVDPPKVATINRGESYIKHIGPERVKAAVTSGRYIRAAETKPFGFMAFCPGPGLGGHGELKMTSVLCTAEAFAPFDVLVLATGHEQFKDPALYRSVKLVVDTRNIISSLFASRAGGPRIVKA